MSAPQMGKSWTNTGSVILTAIEGLSFGFLSLALYAIPMTIAYFIFHAIAN